MKQFSLEEYSKNPNREVITRGSRKVRIICTDRKYTNYPIIALIDFGDREEINYYPKNGRFLPKTKSANDLVFVPEKHEGWINIYKDFHQATTHSGNVYDSEIEAKNNINKIDTYITTVKVEWEE